MKEPRSTRHYNVSDAHMLGSATDFLISYRRHQATLAALDPTIFSPTFEESLDAAITKAEKMPSDRLFSSEKAQETYEQKSVMDACLAQVRLVRYYLVQRLSTSHAIINHLEYHILPAVRNSPDKMVLFMEDFSGVLAANEITLLEHHFPMDLIKSIALLSQQLKSERYDKKEATAKRALATEQRIELMNEVWRLMMQLNNASKYCFERGALGRQAFILPAQKRRSIPKKNSKKSSTTLSQNQN